MEDSENTLEKNNELLIKINKEYNLLSSTKTNDVNEDDSEIDIRKDFLMQSKDIHPKKLVSTY